MSIEIKQKLVAAMNDVEYYWINIEDFPEYDSLEESLIRAAEWARQLHSIAPPGGSRK